MNEVSDSVHISVRLADGSFFPIIHRGGSGKRILTIVPSRHGQERVDLQFFHYAAAGDNPRELGGLSFDELPPGEDIELTLTAEIGPEGSLTAALEHSPSGRRESAEFTFSEEAPAVPRDRFAVFRRIMGVIFVLVMLGLILMATYRFAEWGRREPEAPPVSSEAGRIDAAGLDVRPARPETRDLRVFPGSRTAGQGTIIRRVSPEGPGEFTRRGAECPAVRRREFPGSRREFT